MLEACRSHTPQSRKPLRRCQAQRSTCMRSLARLRRPRCREAQACIRLLTLPLYRVRWPSLGGVTKGWPCNADWHCILRITDPSITSEEDPHGTIWQDVLVFAPQHNALPNPRNQYDIVRLHRIYVRLCYALFPALSVAEAPDTKD